MFWYWILGKERIIIFWLCSLKEQACGNIDPAHVYMKKEQRGLQNMAQLNVKVCVQTLFWYLPKYLEISSFIVHTLWYNKLDLKLLWKGANYTVFYITNFNCVVFYSLLYLKLLVWHQLRPITCQEGPKTIMNKSFISSFQVDHCHWATHFEFFEIH